jgi:arylsulfatase A-like enzyme
VGAAIQDLAPTLLHVMGVPIPGDMDGRPLLGALDGAYRERRLEYTDAGDNGDRPRLEYSKQEEKQIAERLRGLGYL